MALKHLACNAVQRAVATVAVLVAVILTMIAGPSFAATVAYPMAFSAGWNLVGNSIATSFDVRANFGGQSAIQTVWKWDTAASKWAFYAPSLDTAGTLAAYTASKGYAVLTTINQGEGYWVNASTPFTLATQSGTGFSLTASNLLNGWNLVATADESTPGAFSTQAGNVTTLWAWDNATSTSTRKF